MAHEIEDNQYAQNSAYPSVFVDQRLFMHLAGQSMDKWNPEQAARYAAHIQEEARELAEAHAAGDYVKAVDGAVDAIVVAIGYLHSLGVDAQAAWDAVMKANLRKVNGHHGAIVYREDGQIGKPEGWVGPEDKLADLVALARPAE